FSMLIIHNQLFAQGNAANTPAADETDNITARPPLWVRGSVRPTPFLAASPGAYSPAQIRHAYGFDQPSRTGAGQVIAIVDAYGSLSLANDLSTFCATFGIPQASLSIYYPQGRSARVDSGWALETSLDVEWAHAIAPGAKI